MSEVDFQKKENNLNPIARLLRGFYHVIDGLKLIAKSKEVRRWAIIPFIIDIALVVFGLGYGIASISGWVASALGLFGLTASGFFTGILFYLLSALLWVGYLIVVIYGVFLLATVIAAPFNGLLAERTLMHLGVIQAKPFQFGPWVRLSIKLLGAGLIKSLLFAFIGIFIFLGSFIPGVNFLCSFLALLIMSFDSADYSFESLEMGLGERFRYFRQQIPEFSGMAGFLVLTIFVPGLTLVLLPCSVVGAAIVVQKRKVDDPR